MTTLSKLALTDLRVLPGVGVVEGGLLDPVPHLRHLPDGPDNGHGRVLGDGDISRISEVTEGFPENRNYHSCCISISSTYL